MFPLFIQYDMLKNKELHKSWALGQSSRVTARTPFSLNLYPQTSKQLMATNLPTQWLNDATSVKRVLTTTAMENASQNDLLKSQHPSPQ